MPKLLNDAIHECLIRCRGTDAPLAHLAAYCQELRHAGWRDADIRAVEMAVVKLLSAIIDSVRTEEVPSTELDGKPADASYTSRGQE